MIKAAALAILMTACAGSAPIDVQPGTDQDATVDVTEQVPEAAEPVAEVPEVSAAEVAADEPTELTFMQECVASGIDIATCHGLEIGWLHTLSHAPFMAACVEAYGSDDLTIAQCQALWLRWWPTH